MVALVRLQRHTDWYVSAVRRPPKTDLLAIWLSLRSYVSKTKMLSLSVYRKRKQEKTGNLKITLLHRRMFGLAKCMYIGFSWKCAFGDPKWRSDTGHVPCT